MLKKIAAITLSAMLAASVSLGTVASAASVLTEDTGTLTLVKYEPAHDTVAAKTNKVSGAQFTAYQVVDLANGTYKATENFKNVPGLNALLTNDEYTDATGGLTYSVTDDFEALIPSLQTAAASVTADSATNGHRYTSTEGTGANKGTYTFGDMAIGVYLVQETTVPASYTATTQTFLVSIPEWDNATNAWNYDVTAYPKDTPITVNKDIVETDNSRVDETTRAIGDNVDYIVESSLPNYGGADKLTAAQIAATTYYFEDTMCPGLTYNYDMVVKIDGTVLPAVTEVVEGDDITNYTVAVTHPDGKTKITVNFNWASLNDSQGKPITYEYSATLNEDAVIGPVGNDNTVQITFSKDPTTGTGTTTTPPDSTKVYTYEMDLTKTFNGKTATAAGVDASGVEFSIKKGGNKIWFIREKATPIKGVYTAYSKAMTDNPATPADEGVAPSEGAEVTIDGTTYIVTQKLNPKADGTLVVKGLNVGEYTLTEEKSIDGYSKLASDVAITVADTKTSNVVEGKVVATVGEETLDVSQSNLGVFLFTVNNVSKQFDLPLTGGTGTLLIIVGGFLLTATGIILFAQLRKRNKSK